MSDDIWNARREKLEEAAYAAIMALFDHTGASAFAMPLTKGQLDGKYVTVFVIPARGGWVVMPEEPTDEMLLKGCEAGLSTEALMDNARFSCERMVYSAMVKARPRT